MKIPTKFTLGAITWKVKEVDDLGDRSGQTDCNKAIILLEKNPNKQVLAQVYLHELCHVHFYEAGKSEHEEELVDKLARSWHQYLEEVYEDL